jgi:hypothetical protein
MGLVCFALLCVFGFGFAFLPKQLTLKRLDLSSTLLQSNP